ncbi:MAG: DUF4340 domain-containing protein [Clostridia bacterium]|nr:DUF4340 domain-containing protein [Clostridia bacterium]
MPLKKPILITSIIALILAAVLMVITLLPESENTPEQTDSPTIQEMFDTNHIDHLESFSYRYGEKDTVSFTHTQDGWQITNRPGLPLNSEAVLLMLREYRQILALRTVTEEATNLAEYGLDTPSLEVTITDHGKTKTYLFGDENEVYEGYYCTIKGSSAVYLLDVAYFTAFETPLEELLLTEKLPDLSKAREIQWTLPDGTVQETTEALKGALATLSIDRLIDFGSEKYPAYHLDHPTTAVITLSDGTGITLYLAKGETKELVYLVMGDREIIYLVTSEDMNTLLEYLPENETTKG